MSAGVPEGSTRDGSEMVVGAEVGCSQSVGGGFRIGVGEWWGLRVRDALVSLWCAYVSLCLDGLVRGS